MRLLAAESHILAVRHRAGVLFRHHPHRRPLALAARSYPRQSPPVQTACCEGIFLSAITSARRPSMRRERPWPHPGFQPSPGSSTPGWGSTFEQGTGITATGIPLGASPKLPKGIPLGRMRKRLGANHGL
jgi:hypothetical protein